MLPFPLRIVAVQLQLEQVQKWIGLMVLIQVNGQIIFNSTFFEKMSVSCPYKFHTNEQLSILRSNVLHQHNHLQYTILSALHMKINYLL